MSECKGCGKEIVWAVDEKGTNIPLDKSAPVYIETGIGHMRGMGVKRKKRAYVSHFATCPKANDFSKSKKEEIEK